MRSRFKHSRIVCLALVIATSMILSGCSSFDNFRHTFIDDNSEKNEDTIYIGVYEPKTGNKSEQGLNEIKGIELANSVYSNVKGADIKLVYVDTQSDTAASKTAIKNLIELNPIAIIGSAGEASSMIASQYIEEAKIPTITPSSINPLITEGNPYYFRACMTEAQKGKGMANYAYDGLKSREIGIVSVKNDSSADALVDGFREEIKALSREDEESPVVLNTRIPIDETDYSKVVNKIAESEAEVVFMPVGIEKADAIFTEIENAGMTNVTFLGNQSWNSDDFVKVMDKHPSIEVAFPSDTVVLKDSTTKGTVTAETQRFLVEYAKKYGVVDVPTENAVLGYDAYLILINAINNAEELTPISVRAALADTAGLRCATGVFTFDGSGSPVRTVNISTVDDGQIVSVYVTSQTSEAGQMKKIDK